MDVAFERQRPLHAQLGVIIKEVPDAGLIKAKNPIQVNARQVVVEMGLQGRFDLFTHLAGDGQRRPQRAAVDLHRAGWLPVHFVGAAPGGFPFHPLEDIKRAFVLRAEAGAVTRRQAIARIQAALQQFIAGRFERQ